MIRQDFHVHTTYCDGAHTPREMVEAAIEKGMTAIGFSEHAYVSFDEENCIAKEKASEYRAEVRTLQNEYRDKIRILLGIEQDLFSALPTEEYDYVIGSVHYIKKGDRYYGVDISPESFAEMAKEAYGGDYYALCEDYFGLVSSVAEKIRPTIIGHFDLICKFNEGGKFFDEAHPRYVTAWQNALSTLLPYKIPFEVNTGAISRGYKTVPYPSLSQLEYIKEKGGKVILSGDVHHRDNLCYQFDVWEQMLTKLGASYFEM